MKKMIVCTITLAMLPTVALADSTFIKKEGGPAVITFPSGATISCPDKYVLFFEGHKVFPEAVEVTNHTGKYNFLTHGWAFCKDEATGKIASVGVDIK